MQRNTPTPATPRCAGQLANFHGVDVQRIVLAASASEFIFRISALVAQRGARAVFLPPHGYGDYAQAAHAYRLVVQDWPGDAALCWACDPSSPNGGEIQNKSCRINSSTW